MFTDYTALQLPFTPHMLTFTIKIHKMIQLLMSQFLISQSVRFRDQPFARPVFQYGVDEDTAKPALQLSQFKVEICSPIVGGSLPNDCLLTVDVTHISCKVRWFISMMIEMKVPEMKDVTMTKLFENVPDL